MFVQSMQLLFGEATINNHQRHVKNKYVFLVTLFVLKRNQKCAEREINKLRSLLAVKSSVGERDNEK